MIWDFINDEVYELSVDEWMYCVLGLVLQVGIGGNGW